MTKKQMERILLLKRVQIELDAAMMAVAVGASESIILHVNNALTELKSVDWEGENPPLLTS